jgi:hypothetical protein
VFATFLADLLNPLYKKKESNTERAPFEFENYHKEALQMEFSLKQKARLSGKFLDDFYLLSAFNTRIRLAS